MADRELLELAAKAAGVEVYESTDGTLQNRPILVFAAGGGMGTMPYEERWNPLVDDAQALRLANKLWLEVRHVHGQAHAGMAGRFWCTESWFPDGDQDAATRRAIVRAAAEIGRTE